MNIRIFSDRELALIQVLLRRHQLVAEAGMPFTFTAADPDCIKQEPMKLYEVMALRNSIAITPNQGQVLNAAHKVFGGASEALRERASDAYASGSDNNVEIDENALVSEADYGTWVHAWVWVEKLASDRCKVGDQFTNDEKISNNAAVDDEGESHDIAARAVWTVHEIDDEHDEITLWTHTADDVRVETRHDRVDARHDRRARRGVRRRTRGMIQRNRPRAVPRHSRRD
jgi:hypothetical protein